MPLPTRKRDCAYLIFFATHIPIIFLVDTVPLQPRSLVSNLSLSLRDFYITTYRDKFFSDPPTWFTAFIWMELLYHVPLSLWAVWGLLCGEFPSLTLLPKGGHPTYLSGPEATSFIPGRRIHANRRGPPLEHPLVPVHLLIFGVQAFVTSLTCLVEVWNWPDRSVAEKQQITSLYGPYVALGMSRPSPGTFGTCLTLLFRKGAFMALDMVVRLRSQLLPKSKRE